MVEKENLQSIIDLDGFYVSLIMYANKRNPDIAPSEFVSTDRVEEIELVTQKLISLSDFGETERKILNSEVNYIKTQINLGRHEEVAAYLDEMENCISEMIASDNSELPEGIKNEIHKLEQALRS